jgi:hypothetical protein
MIYLITSGSEWIQKTILKFITFFFRGNWKTIQKGFPSAGAQGKLAQPDIFNSLIII